MLSREQEFEIGGLPQAQTAPAVEQDNSSAVVTLRIPKFIVDHLAVISMQTNQTVESLYAEVLGGYVAEVEANEASGRLRRQIENIAEARGVDSDVIFDEALRDYIAANLQSIAIPERRAGLPEFLLKKD